jgi:hypothetical protein
MALVAGNIPISGYQTPDYSGAAQAIGAANAAPYQMISDLTGQVKDYFKQQGNAKKSAQLGIKIAEAAKIMDPQQAPYYDNLIFSMKDENTPVQVRGALGASVQDLLKQNTSMRAVAVQEAQMGMRPAYFGGGQSPARSGGGYGGTASRGYSPSVDMSAGDAALANQPGVIPLPPGPDEFIEPPPGPAGADILSTEQLIERAKSLGVPASKVNPIVSGIQSAFENPNEVTEDTVKRYKGNLAEMVSRAEAGFKPAKDASGKAKAVIIEDESGNVSRLTKTIGGNLIGESGEVLDSGGKPIQQQEYQRFDTESINRALNMDNGVLPPLPDETSMVQPIGTLEEQARVRRMVQEGQGRAMAQNMPQGAVVTDPSLAYQTTQPQPEQKSAGLGLMAQESQARQAQASGEELRKLTELAPRKAKLYESALNQAYQDPKTAPSQDVVDEAKLQLLMQPESKGPQVMSEEEYNQRNVALINKAQKRVGDRSAAEAILSRFDTAQKLANHPEGYKVFGKSIPEATLRELARTQGGVYALYYNLKGQDLVQAMRDIKAQSGTAAGMSEKETMALQRAVNDLDLAQDWKSAQSTLMRIASGTIRAGKKLGLDEGVFEVMPMTPATGTTPASKRQTTKAAEILDNPESVPMFRDEVQYFNRVNSLKSRLQGGQGTGTTQPAPQAQPQSQPSAVTPMGLESIFFPTR